MANESKILVDNIEPRTPGGLVTADAIAMPTNPAPGTLGKAIKDIQQSPTGAGAEIDDTITTIAKTWSSTRIQQQIDTVRNAFFSPQVCRFEQTSPDTWSGDSIETVGFQSEINNTNNFYSTTSGNRNISPAEAGFYKVTAGVTFTNLLSNSPTNSSVLSLLIRGPQSVYMGEQNIVGAFADASENFALTVTAAFYMTPTDAVTILANVNNISSDMQSVPGSTTFVTIHRVS